jgi:hypothetical protein
LKVRSKPDIGEADPPLYRHTELRSGEVGRFETVGHLAVIIDMMR